MTVQPSLEEDYGRGLARACAGALIFGFPLLMTMEMWELGFHMDRLRLVVLIGVTVAVTFGLSRFAGFRDDTTLADDALDAMAALLVGFSVSAALLTVMGVIRLDMDLGEVVGMVAVQAAPATMGAILANKQLQQGAGRAPKEDRAGYAWQLFLMAAGALFFAYNVAPTEEMLLIGFKMSPWHAIALILLSLLALHALVFTVGFAGQREHEGHLRAFLHFTLSGYGVALLVSAYTLWTFGRLDSGFSEAVRAIVVLGFPAALGAALARLVV